MFLRHVFTKSSLVLMMFREPWGLRGHSSVLRNPEIFVAAVLYQISMLGAWG